jgi:hypothetical protein
MLDKFNTLLLTLWYQFLLELSKFVSNVAREQEQVANLCWT